ncbi:MAG: SMP-30/gluconolactonase/LRE family protein [Pseudomonadota bacterium]
MLLRFIRLFATVFVLLLGASYLFMTPAGLEPVAWEPPDNPGLTGVFEPNDRLAGATLARLRGSTGPEDVAVHPEDGSVWTLTRDGELWRLDEARAVAVGRISDGALGLEFGADGALYITDVHLGVLRWTPGGGSERVVSQLEGVPLTFANQLAVARDGTVYFSVSTRRFLPEQFEDTLEVSIHDLWEHRNTGLVARLRPGERVAEVVARGFSYANGVALTPEEDALLIAETGGYAIWRVELNADGSVSPPRMITPALPGFPDNIQAQGDGTFWVGLVSERRAIADFLMPYPGVRALVWRLPEAVRPTPSLHGLLMRIDAQGQILDVLQDPSGGVNLVTGAVASGGRLYVSSLGMGAVAVLDWE